MNLNGWNFVSAIDVKQVNAALQAQRATLIQSFSITTPLIMSGHYADWTIVPGGSGKHLFMEIGIADGTLQTGSGSVSLAGVVIALDIRLDLLDAGGAQHLSFDLSTVTLRDVRNLPPGVGEITAGAFADALVQDLCANADKVSFVLAKITQSSPNTPAWLTPLSPDFAYLQPDGGSAAIAIFARPSSSTPGDLKLDPQVLGPEGFGIAISSQLFMHNVFRPALCAALGLPGDLAFVEQPNGNLQFNGSVGIKSVSAAGETYHPHITSLGVQLVDDRVNMQFAGNCSMGMDISMTFNGSSSVTLGVAGPGVLSFSQIGHSSFDKDVDIPWYDHLLDIAGGVAEIILQVTVAAISSELSGGIRDVAGASALLTQAPDVVAWFGGGYAIDQAGLADALWLHGKHS